MTISDHKSIMTISLVIPSLTLGGAERVMSQLANQLVNSNYTVHLILLTNLPDFYSVDPKVNIHRLGFVNKNPIQKIINELKVFCKLRRLFKSSKSDVVLSFMTKYNILTILASRFLNLNVFVSERNNPLKKISFSLTLGRKIFYKKATGIITQTLFAKSVLKKHTHHNNIEVIENPVLHFETAPFDQREKIIISTGRLISTKNHLLLIRLFSKLNQKGWKLLILGDGPQKKNLQKEIKKLHLEDSIQLLGKKNNVIEYLNRASIFAFASISEGYPNALVEGMCSGLACISFDCNAGPKEIIENGINGFLIKDFNEEDYLDRLQELINSEELRKRFYANALKIKDRNNIKLVTEKFIDFFQKKIEL